MSVRQQISSYITSVYVQYMGFVLFPYILTYIPILSLLNLSSPSYPLYLLENITPTFCLGPTTFATSPHQKKSKNQKKRIQKPKKKKKKDGEPSSSS